MKHGEIPIVHAGRHRDDWEFRVRGSPAESRLRTHGGTEMSLRLESEEARRNPDCTLAVLGGHVRD